MIEIPLMSKKSTRTKQTRKHKKIKTATDLLYTVNRKAANMSETCKSKEEGFRREDEISAKPVSERGNRKE